MTLDVVPVEALTDRAQRFRCVPLACTLRAGACADRQREAQARVTAYRTTLDEKGVALDKPSCVACTLGAQVAARLAAVCPAPAAEPAAPTCEVTGCRQRVGALHPKTPPAYARLCARHRRHAAHLRSTMHTSPESAVARLHMRPRRRAVA